MTDLRLILSWLGMEQYCDRFMQAEFESWEVIMEITEDDLQVGFDPIRRNVLSISQHCSGSRRRIGSQEKAAKRDREFQKESPRSSVRPIWVH